MERIVILDFGSVYDTFIARAVRECGVYCELLPSSSTIEQIRGGGLSGLILSGCYDSVYAEGSRTCTDEIFSLGVPILGICYGMQLISHKLGGRVERAPVTEYGKTFVRFSEDRLFKGIPDSIMWMNHNDWVCALPDGFKCTAETDGCPHGAMSCEERGIYAVQFHPEVKCSEHRLTLFKNFLYDICACRGGWSPLSSAEELICGIRAEAGGECAAAFLYGDIGSTLAAALARRALGSGLCCVFVDHGLYRENEAEALMALYREAGLEPKYVDAKERFLSRLSGVSDPVEKRGRVFTELKRVIAEETRKCGAAWLVSGGLIPEAAEGEAAICLSKGDAGDLFERSGLKGIIEPVKNLFADEARALCAKLGLPDALLRRAPFPASGLACRIIGEVTNEKLDALRCADRIFCEEFEKAGLAGSVGRAFAVHTGIPTISVSGNDTAYQSAIAIRAAGITDAVTAEFAELPYEVLRRVSKRIISETAGVNRVVYDITNGHPRAAEWE